MKRTTNISEARARLPELAKRVAATPGAVEYIEHRDLPLITRDPEIARAAGVELLW